VKIEGSFIVDAPPDRVWPLITDPEHVAPCVPGCDSVEVLGPNVYKAAVKVAIGPIKTKFNIVVEVIEQRPPTFWTSTIRGEEGGKASSLNGSSQLQLRAVESDRTEVRYSSEVSIFGRLGKFGLGMMKKHAETLGDEFAKSFASRARKNAQVASA
jgi:carbon monoxide dehydrogenase subunit G